MSDGGVSGEPAAGDARGGGAAGGPSKGAVGEGAIRRWLVTRLAELSGVAESEVDPSAPFSAYGVDSAAAAEIMSQLEELLDRELEPTVVFSFETPHDLAAYLAAGGTGHERTRVTPRARTTRAADAPHDPVAVVGIGCRFPGARGPAEYWDLLRSGTDAVRTVPEGRWDPDDVPADLPPYARLGGFVEGIDGFDPAFFGISQHEADRMDPQQRMLLEVAWEALEDAEIVPSSVRGGPVGVFVGISANEYGRRQGSDPELVDVFFGTGNALSIAANRISYALDLRGPSLAVDTACSSSLVAVHQAVAAIRNGECDLALAGGANAILTPLLTLNFTNAGVIAPDGRCKTFDASADGIVRGEGAGMVVLKPLSRAVADGDRIYCVVEGSATNSDGRSNGLTAPNPEAQVEVFAAACADAGVDPATVAFVEAHGTGTVLGDAMELRSLDAVYGSARTSGARTGGSTDDKTADGAPPPLLVGSAKTNLGHLESAAGIAGTIKAALSLHHGEVPPNLHFETPNPYLDDTTGVRVADRLQPWPEGAGRRAGVSGFGFGGTNAHVVLGPAPERDPSTPTAPGGAGAEGDWPLVLPLSARTEVALATLAGRHAELVAQDPDLAPELAAAQALTRDQHPRRAAIVAADLDELGTALDAVAEGRANRAVSTGERRGGDRAQVVFVFSGQGRAWWPLDAELLADPVIRPVLEQCDVELRELADFSLMDVIRQGEPVLDHERAQPILYALQVALAARWRAFGVEPDLIVGQSIGEIAAAHVAGALRMADGLEVVLNRGRFMEESNGIGHTAFVELPADEVAAMIAEMGVEVTVAGITAPDNCLISGPKADTVALVEAAKERGVMAQVFAIGDIPGHGPLMTPYAEKLTAAVEFLDPRPARVPVVSTVTGQLIDGTDLDAAYWGRNLRQTVRLTDAMATAVDLGGEVFVEVAPHPVVAVSARRCLEAMGAPGIVQHTVKQGEPGALALRRSLGAVWAGGAAVDWRAVTGRSRATVAAPTYPWDERRCWFDPPHRERVRQTDVAERWHPLLGEPQEIAGTGGTIVATVSAGETEVPALGRAPAAAVVVESVAALAGRALGSDGSVAPDGIVLRDVELVRDIDPATDLQVLIEGRPGPRAWHVAGREGGRWRTVATGTVEPGAPAAAPLGPSRLAVDGERTEDPAALAGILGEEDRPGSQRVLRAVVRAPAATVATLEAPADLAPDAAWTSHPALLGAALEMAAARVGPEGEGGPFVPSRLGTVVLRGPVGPGCRALVEPADDGGAAVVLVDEWGAPLVEVDSITWESREPGADDISVLGVRWEEQPLPTGHPSAERRWFCVAGDDDPLAAEVAAATGAERGDLDQWLDSIGSDASAVVVIDRGAPGGGELRPLLATVERMLAHPGPTPRLYVVTTAGRGLEGVPAEADAALACSLLPTVTAMHPEYRPTGIDLEPVPDGPALVAELLADRPDDAVALRGGRRLVARLAEEALPAAPEHLLPADGRPHRARWTDSGRLVVEPAPIRRATADRAVVEVAASLLQRSDLDDRPAGEVPGAAAVGTVVSAPEGSPLRAGTPVAVVARGTLASHVVVAIEDLVPLDGAAPTAATEALGRLAVLLGDLPSSYRRDPGAVRAAVAQLLAAGSGDGPGSAGPVVDLADLPDAVADAEAVDAPFWVGVGAPDTPLTVTVDRWEADPDGTYLVAGSDDDATALLAGHLGSRGAGRVLVAHSSPGAVPDPSVPTDRPVPVDLDDADAVATLVALAESAGGPLRGVVCVAGAATAAAELLDDATAAAPLELFVAVGSTTTSLGAGTVSAEADSLGHVVVQRRLSRGRPALALDLGPIAGGDHGSDEDAEHLRHLAHIGVRPLAPRVLSSGIDRLLVTASRAGGLVAVDHARFAAAAGPAARRPWFAPFAPPPDEVTVRAAESGLAEALVAADPADRMSVITASVREDLAEILGIAANDIDTTAPVDDYGVDSLVGMELRSRFDKQLGYLFPLSDLSRTLSTEELALHLHDHALPALLAGAGGDGSATAAAAGSPATGAAVEVAAGAAVVPLRTGSGPATWWAPGLFGAPEVFAPLGEALGEREAWAFRAPGLESGTPLRSVDELAGTYLALLRSKQPHGPYHLGGYSFGGLVMAEVARRLEEDGERVAHLWLVDPPPPTAAGRARSGDRVRELMAEHLDALFPPAAGSAPLEAPDLPATGDDAGMAGLADRLAAGSTAFDRDQVLSSLKRLWSLVDASTAAMASDRAAPAKLSCPVTLVHAAERSLFVPEGQAADAEWAVALGRPIQVTTFEADHTAVLRPPHAGALAALVVRHLERSAAARDTDSPETPMTATTESDAPAAPGTLAKLSESPKVRDAIGAAGAAYNRANFYLRALAAERRFRRLCSAEGRLTVGEHGQIVNLSGDPDRVRFGHHCIVDGYVNVQELGRFTMGSYSALGINARVDCSGYVEIGNGCSIAQDVYIIDGLHHPLLANARIEHGIDLFSGSHIVDAYSPGTETSFVRIEDLVWVGLRAIVLSGVTIGRGSVVAAGAVVSQDVPPFSVFAGNPGRVIGRLPEEEFDIATHPAYLRENGDLPLPDHRRDIREVMEEVQRRIAERRR